MQRTIAEQVKALDFALYTIALFFETEKEVAKGLLPMSYRTLSYEGDVEQQEEAKSVINVLLKMREDLDANNS